MHPAHVEKALGAVVQRLDSPIDIAVEGVAAELKRDDEAHDHADQRDSH